MATVAPDPFIVLGVTRETSISDIKRAYRRLAREHHPDANGGDLAAQEQFQRINAAFKTIGSEEKRAKFLQLEDRNRRSVINTQQGKPTVNTARLPAQGDDIHTEIQLTFEQAFRGERVQLDIPMKVPCQTCGGTGAAPGTNARRCPLCQGSGVHQVGRLNSVCGGCEGRGVLVDKSCPDCTNGAVETLRQQILVVPAGVADGSRMRVKGKGQPGLRSAGDLVVTVKVQPSELFQVFDDVDLVIDVPISYAEACLGKEITIPTPEKWMKLNIPAGSNSGRLLRIRGQGLSKNDPDGNPVRGHLYARLHIVVPEQLSPEQRRLVRRLGAADDGDIRRHFVSGKETESDKETGDLQGLTPQARLIE